MYLFKEHRAYFFGYPGFEEHRRGTHRHLRSVQLQGTLADPLTRGGEDRNSYMVGTAKASTSEFLLGFRSGVPIWIPGKLLDTNPPKKSVPRAPNM